MMSPSKKIKGFTLIELLIVLVLIGLTTSFVLPNMWQQLDQAKFHSEKKQLSSIIQFAKEYSLYKGSSLELVILKNSLEIYELKPEVSNTPKEKPESSLFFEGEVGADMDSADIDSEVNDEQKKLLKRIDFTAFSLEPLSHIFNANNYFQQVNITIIAQGMSENEKVKI